MREKHSDLKIQYPPLLLREQCIDKERSEDTLQRLLEKVNRVPLHEDFHFRVTNGQRAEVKRACTAKEYL